MCRPQGGGGAELRGQANIWGGKAQNHSRWLADTEDDLEGAIVPPRSIDERNRRRPVYRRSGGSICCAGRARQRCRRRARASGGRNVAMSSPMDISVVICAYTEARWDDLVAAVESIQCQSLPAREILVVVDHNSNLLDRARTHLPGVRAVENHEPRGLSGARNSGIAAARGSAIA